MSYVDDVTSFKDPRSEGGKNKDVSSVVRLEVLRQGGDCQGALCLPIWTLCHQISRTQTGADILGEVPSRVEIRSALQPQASTLTSWLLFAREFFKGIV